jgi:photosystem II stability/assembly factor-like uncharacterized protein
MRIKKESVITYLLVSLLIAGGICLLLFLDSGITGFVVFEQDDQSDFDEGIYSDTEWNVDHVGLSSGQTSGIYTSKIFDAGNDAVWNDFSWSGSNFNVNEIYVVDNQADVWKSTNDGVDWTLVKDDYNGATSNGANAMTSDGTYLYIMHGQDTWRSGDYGITWEKVNDDFNGGSSSNSFFIVYDGNALFVIDGAEDIYTSIDNGGNWSQISEDMNGGNGNIFGFVADSSGNLWILDTSADVWKSTNDGVDWTLVKDDYNEGEGNNPSFLYVDDSDYFYIVEGDDDIWKSEDAGLNWIKVNDDYNGEGNHFQAGTFFNNYLHIIEGDEDVWSSNDEGVNWNKQAVNFNGGNGDPAGMTGVTRQTSLDFQARSCDDSSCSGESWTDITDISPQDFSLDNNTYFQYKISFLSSDSSMTPELQSVSIDYTLLNTAPIINLDSPQDGATYGYNENLALDFSVSDSDDNLQTCWYSLDGGSNTTIADCANTTFDVAGNGIYVLNVFANDSIGEEVSDSSIFNVQIGAPTIELSSPMDSYLTDYEVTFRYTPTDIDLDYCELWGNFTEPWHKNQTDNFPTNGTENTFDLTLSDGVYFWNILCEDDLGNSAMNGNKTFYIDTINPEISLTEPSGAKTSRAISMVWNVSDDNLDSCWYNVYRGENIEITNTSVTCGDNSASFDVTIDASFILNFYVNDFAGNLNFTSSSFSVDTSSGGTVVVSSGGGGGSSYTPVAKNTTPELSVGNIQNLIVSLGDVKKVNWFIKNLGASFLNNCEFKSIGEFSSWIDYTETKNLASGEEYTFKFDLNVPQEIESGKYNLGVILECNELVRSSNFIVEVLRRELDFRLIKVERIGEEQVKIIYFLEELSNLDQDVELQFLLFDSHDEKVAEINEIKSILANSKGEFEILIPISPLLEGNLNLLVNLNSETYSTFIKEDIILASPSGFFVFGDFGQIDDFATIVIVVLFLLFAFFKVRKIVGHKKSKKKLKKKKK